MQTSFSTVALIVVFCLTLLNLALTMRVVTWLRSAQERRERAARAETAKELVVGGTAPDFTARTVTGEYVSLRSYLGRSTLFVFFSNECFRCRKEMPMLVKLGKTAKARADIDFVLVSEVGASDTIKWKDWLLDEDKIDIDLPFVVSPSGQFNFFELYNPRNITPYYCLLDPTGRVQSRSPVGHEDWEALKREWEGLVALPARNRRHLH